MSNQDVGRDAVGMQKKQSMCVDFAERRLCQLLFLSFGVLCILQATLNVALRLTLYSNKESTHSGCNVTHFSDQNQVKEVQMDCKYNRLQERLNALTRDRDLLENRNTELTNTIKAVEEDRDRWKMKLRELSGCASSQQCPADWKEINSRCYFLSTESKTWEDSRTYCLSKDADLVVINSEEEQRALYRLDGKVDLLFWIGLYDTAGTFKWVDGSALTRPFWQSGQPDRGGPNNREDCVEMYHFNQVVASWNDAPCGAKRRWLCEKDPYTSS
ncbi:C-type lectin domain family 4 member M-like isoform X1 [Siniperca chuatsi]|uniref:C-type lectin domain family 4 member M-like isoform X1 n=1 Tax=Siniperca chuatsi TaxID=119488 RepID=UPI001CE122C7|nr:C-type lectin domain family 4 member M-like isoform X1 [Siniperca chuatsi]